jgi:CheY-like chemotaxis protein
MERPTVLVVEAETKARDGIADWLDHAGYEVEACPGPSSPDYTCIGGRGLPCPLAVSADVVVLNDHLASDTAMQGTPGWQLLTYYMEIGKSVVALVDASDFVVPRDDDNVRVLRRPVDKKSLLKAVAELTNSAEE